MVFIFFPTVFKIFQGSSGVFKGFKGFLGVFKGFAGFFNAKYFILIITHLVVPRTCL